MVAITRRRLPYKELTEWFCARGCRTIKRTPVSPIQLPRSTFLLAASRRKRREPSKIKTGSADAIIGALILAVWLMPIK